MGALSPCVLRDFVEEAHEGLVLMEVEVEGEAEVEVEMEVEVEASLIRARLGSCSSWRRPDACRAGSL